MRCNDLTLNNDNSQNMMFSLTADQTPTPTKFLRNCEEIGLFNEINKNPFEEAFRKASTDGVQSATSDHHDVNIMHKIIYIYIYFIL